MEPVLPVEEQDPARPARRSLQFQDLERVSYSADRLPKDFIENVLRAAARLWASANDVTLGNMSTPRQLPRDDWRCTARCHRCAMCVQGAGKVFAFTGCWARAGIFELSVHGAGACHGEPQKARKAKKHKDDEITIGQREQVVKAAEALLVTSRKATTAAVAIRMGPGIPRARIRTILRSHKRKYGAGTSEWTESQDTFEAFAATRDTEKLEFTYTSRPGASHEELAARVRVFILALRTPFQWVVRLTGFFEAARDLHSRHPDAIHVTSDFTFRLAIMGYSYGVLCTSTGIGSTVV